ncbi:hypothetical protein Tco_0640355 [Tanacetum coccineum]
MYLLLGEGSRSPLWPQALGNAPEGLRPQSKYHPRLRWRTLLDGACAINTYAPCALQPKNPLLRHQHLLKSQMLVGQSWGASTSLHLAHCRRVWANHQYSQFRLLRTKFQLRPRLIHQDSIDTGTGA